MNENGKRGPVEAILRIGVWTNENNVSPFANVTVYPQYNNNTIYIFLKSRSVVAKDADKG
jgi:hypothetical protein